MKLQDDRTPEQKKTHLILVVGTDTFMSGWGQAEGGKSYAAWACKPEHEKYVTEWVERRSDMQRVRVTVDPYKPSGKGHAHIYVVDDFHPSLNSYNRMMGLLVEKAV